MHRDTFLLMPLNELLRACTIKGFSENPGGQHRNKSKYWSLSQAQPV